MVNVSVVRIMLKKYCQCGEDYVGDTATRWSAHNNPKGKSEATQHIKKHLFDWSILHNAPSNNQIKKNLDTLFIGIIKPSLNEQTRSFNTFP